MTKALNYIRLNRQSSSRFLTELAATWTRFHLMSDTRVGVSVEAGASQQAGVGQRVPSRRPVHPLLTHTQQLLRLTRECPLTLIHTHRERERERQTDTQRETDRQTDTQRETDRQTDTHRERETDRQTDTHRERERHTHRERERERETDRHTHNTDTQRERERDKQTDTHTRRDRQTHFLCELLLLLGYPFMNHITKRVKVNMILKPCVHVLTCSVWKDWPW